MYTSFTGSPPHQRQSMSYSSMVTKTNILLDWKPNLTEVHGKNWLEENQNLTTKFKSIVLEKWEIFFINFFLFF